MGFLAEIDLQAEPADSALVFAFHEGRLLVRRHEDRAAPVAYGDVAAALEGAIARIYLGRLDGRPCFAIPLAAEPETPPGHAFLGLRELFGQLEEPIHGVAGAGLPDRRVVPEPRAFAAAAAARPSWPPGSGRGAARAAARPISRASTPL